MPHLSRRRFLQAGLTSAAGLFIAPVAWGDETTPWPPALPGVHNGKTTLQTEQFLQVPDAVTERQKESGAAEFIVAKEPPSVTLAFHDNLGPDAATRRLWSSWGDICLASDGKVYCAIGDHGKDAEGNAHCFLYVWDPSAQTLEQIVDMNRVIPPRPGQPAWSKVHAKVDEGADGQIYFSCTLNNGNAADNEKFHWTKELPGGQLYQYDPATRRVSIVTTLPNPPRCTATSRYDLERDRWWCNLEVGDNALWCLDLKTRETVFKAPDGSTGFNRNFALGRNGNVYFNGPENTLWKYDNSNGKIQQTKSEWGESPGMRSSTGESSDGHIYGTTHRTGQLFRYTPAEDRLTLLGKNWLTGDYVTVAELSPDERFVYYLPGAHGKAFRSGTPVIQYEIESGRRKVIAFLAPAFEQTNDYVPAGTYGLKVSADGSTLYVNFNGHAAKNRPSHLKPIGFGLCSFAEIRIPPSEL